MVGREDFESRCIYECEIHEVANMEQQTSDLHNIDVSQQLQFSY